MASSSRAEGFALGVLATSAAFAAAYYFSSVIEKRRKKQGYHVPDDAFQSLFYGPESKAGPGGAGFPVSPSPGLHSVSLAMVKALTAVQPDYRKLPSEFYKFAVEHLPLVCVDVVLQRPADGKLLLFFRKDKPAAKIWWWPGGRMFRGETFADTALRKIREETGAGAGASATAVGIVSVWNTLFPDSSWDSGRKPEHYGTQTVNVTVFCRLDDDLDLDSEVARRDWAVEGHQWVHPREVLASTSSFDKYVTLNVSKCMELGYF